MKFTCDNGVLIEVNIVGRENPHSDDYWDANWLEANIKIDVVGFSAAYSSNLRVDELQSFYKTLTDLVDLHTNKAELTTIEQGLYFLCSANRRGQVVCLGRARHQHNQLNFEFETDIPTMHRWLSEIEAILKQYPLIGNPNASNK